jgi:hypothetical protein
MVIEDTGALIQFIDRGGEPVRPGGIGSIGYCMGGRHVLCVTGAYPDRFAAGASLHGTALISDRADSPHRLAHRFRGELYCGFAEHDPHAPPTMIKELGDLLNRCPVTYRHEFHSGTEHGYALPNRDIHDKHAGNRDWELIFAMFRRQLPLDWRVTADTALARKRGGKMKLRMGRRGLLAGSAAVALAMDLPCPAIGQETPVRIGLLTVKTGPLAQGGFQMEQGFRCSSNIAATSLPGARPS